MSKPGIVIFLMVHMILNISGIMDGTAIRCPVQGYAYGGQEEKMSNRERIEDVLSRHTDELMNLPGVVGVGLGVCDDRPCIKVFVVERTPEIERKIPKQIDQFPLDIEETGEFRPLH